MDNVDRFTSRFNTVLSELLDKHAPSQKRTIIIRPPAPWYDDTIRMKKKLRNKFERRWRKSKLCLDRELYKEQCDVVNRRLFEDKMTYYSGLIEENRAKTQVALSKY